MPGVMRFLQLEWHNHERARNAWDIERAEMKAKIAKQEGEVRSAKKLNDQLNKHIRMLEQALMNERAKAKAAAAGGDTQAAADDKKDAKGKKGGVNATKRVSTLPTQLRVVETSANISQPRATDTTPSSMSNPISTTDQRPTATACARSRSCTLRNVSRK
jgi:LPS O-antigen subunit length determinant protein (WzzB/FepE family)